MSSDLEARLSADVMGAYDEIQKKMRSFATNGNKNQFKFGYIVLRSLCNALQASNDQHLQTYCDIAENIIFPKMNPCEDCEAYWDSFLGVLRFLLHVLAKKDIKLHNQCYDAIVSKRYKLRNTTDYTYFLEIHMQHLNFQKRQPQTTYRDTQILTATEALSDLFEEMINMKQNKNFSCPDLINVLNKSLLGKRSPNNAKFLYSLSTQSSSKMFTSLFRLLSLSTLPKPQLSTYSQEYLNAFFVFLMVDMNDTELKQQLALQHLRCCRDVFKEDVAFEYYYQLLYYLLKLAYKRNKTPEFRQTYLELCKKFVIYFERYAEAHTKSQWYIDFLVTLDGLYAELHYCSSNFDVFWQQMAGDIELYCAHFSLISCCVKLSPGITQCQFGLVCASAQCTSLRKHVILSLGTSAVTALTTFVQQQQANSSEDVNDLKKSCLHILRYTISVLETMQCVNATSTEFLFFLRKLIGLASHIKTAAMANFYIQIVNLLPKLRTNISPTDWLSLLRRVYKVATLCETNVAIMMHCVYISSLIKDAMPVSQIIAYYQYKKGAEKCISEVLSECQSPLMTELTVQQKRSLFSQELLIALHYFKQNVPLLKSLLRCKQTSHDYVMIARHLKADKEVNATLKELLAEYRKKSYKGKQTRLDKLVYAYVCTKQLTEMVEMQKIQLDIMDVNELNFEEYLAKKNVVRIDSEMKVLDMAMEALNGFQAFYDNADAEPFGPDDYVLIDWESITDDVLQLGNTLQVMGYIAQSTDAWLLLLRMTSLLDDRYKYLRAVSYFFAHCELFESDSRIDLDKELDRTQQILGELIPQLAVNDQIFNRHRTFALFCLCHLANFYARTGRWHYGYVLLAQVERLQSELKERHGKFDIILLTMYTVRFRLIWQHRTAKVMARPSTNVMRLMDMILENFRNFASFSSVDQNLCLLCVIDFVRNSIECSANRIGDRISLVNTVLNLTLQTGLALRTIQLLTALLLLNLQMENVDKARANLRLIEYFFGRKTIGFNKATNLKQSNECHDEVNTMLSLHENALFVEPIRKQSVVQLSEQLKRLDIVEKTPVTKLQTFLKTNDESKYLHGCPQLEWTFFVVGSLTARLHFLTKDIDQLDKFYMNADHWLQKRATQKLLRDYFKSMQLVHTSFRINYMRVAKAHAQAIEQLAVVLTNLENFKNVDINYRCNLLLQQQVVLEEQKRTPMKMTNLRRALTFNDSPEELTTNIETTKRTNQTAEKNTKSRIVVKVTKLDAELVKQVITPTMHDESSATSSSGKIDLNSCQIIEISDSNTSDEDIAKLDKKQKTVTTKANKVKTTATQRIRIPLNANADNVALTKSTNIKCKKVTPKAETKKPEELPVSTSQKKTRSKATVASSATKNLEEIPSVRKTRNQLRRLAGNCKENLELK